MVRFLIAVYIFSYLVRPEFIMNFDLWHKVYPFTKAWKSFVNERIIARGSFKYPFLRELLEKKLLTAKSFKSWWVNLSEVFFLFFLFDDDYNNNSITTNRLDMHRNSGRKKEIFQK